MISFRTLPVKTRLTAAYTGVLALVIGLYIAGTCVILYWQLRNQVTRFAIQDVETIEGLLYFNQNHTLKLNEDYHNHPQSRLILERLLEVFESDGKVLYRNERLGNRLLGGPTVSKEGLNSYSPRTESLSDGTRALVVSRRHNLNGVPILIRLGYEQSPIWSRLKEFLTASFTAFPFLLSVAAYLAFLLARRSLSPLKQMATHAEQITVDRLNQRLPILNPEDELGHLARVFNTLLDRLEQSFDQLKRFTADASHEMRTPLAAIRSVGEVGLQRNTRPSEYEDTIGSMLEEVSRLAGLVENLLTMSRADAGQIQVHLSPILLSSFLPELLEMVGVLAEEKNQAIAFTIPDDIAVTGDRLLLRSAVLNILHNAVKYTPHGGKICISVEQGQASYVSLKIEDSGPGIPPEHREKVFHRFYRIDNARSREKGGVGLGLAISNWAVRAQGGRIRIANGENLGSTFVIELKSAARPRPKSAH